MNMETYKLYLHAHVPTNDYVQCMCVFTRRCMHVYMTVYMNVCVLEARICHFLHRSPPFPAATPLCIHGHLTFPVTHASYERFWKLTLLARSHMAGKSQS